MPAPIVKKLALEKGISVKEAENRWDKAKKVTKEQTDMTEDGGDDFWAYVVGVFKKSMGVQASMEDHIFEYSNPSEIEDSGTIEELKSAFMDIFSIQTPGAQTEAYIKAKESTDFKTLAILQDRLTQAIENEKGADIYQYLSLEIKFFEDRLMKTYGVKKGELSKALNLENAFPIKATPQKGAIVGNSVVSYLNDNTPIKLRYEALPLKDIITSHNEDMEIDDRYPAELQPRERSRKASLLQVESIAGGLNPERLGQSSNVAHGAPIISKDSNVVESGNGRTLAVRKAYSGKKGEEYKAWLVENASSFGIDQEKVKAMDRPVLVRRREDSMSMGDVIKFTQQANEADTAKFSSSEQAVVDAKRLTPDDMALFRPDQNGNIAAPSNRAFVNMFLDKMSPEERSGYLTEDGRATKQAFDRIQSAIFQKAYGSDELLKLTAEEADPDIKNILNGLNAASGSFAKAKSMDENLAGIPIVNELVDGIGILRRAQREYPEIKSSDGKSKLLNQLKQTLNQQDVFGDPYSENAKTIALILAENIRSGKRIGEVMEYMAEQLKEYIADQNQMDIFGDKKTLSADDLISSAKDFIGDKYSDKQINIFESSSLDNKEQIISDAILVNAFLFANKCTTQEPEMEWPILESAFLMWDSPDETIGYIKMSTSIEGIQVAFNRTFSLGDEKERASRLAMVDAVLFAIDQAKKAKPDSLDAILAFEALSVYRLNGQVRADTGIDSSVVVELSKSIITDTDKIIPIAYESYSAIGKTFLAAMPDDTAEKIKKVSEGIKYLKENIQTLTRETQGFFAKSRQDVFTSDEFKVAHKEYRNKIQAVADGHQEYFDSKEFIALPYKERRKEYNSRNRLYKKEVVALAAEWKETEKPFFSGIDDRANDTIELATREQKRELEALEMERRGHAQIVKEAILIKLFESSPISEEQAQEWVDNNVHVADNALSRPKRSKVKTYENPDAIKTDMKEFYRLTGGKVGRIKIVTKGGSRASANRQTGEIAVDSNFSKKTLFHEMGHHVEFNNRVINQTAQHYRSMKATSDKLMSMRSLAHNGYKPNEMAYSDGFFDPYVGKYYPDGATEVISMGLQQLSSTENVLDLLTKDREHLEMVVGMAAQKDDATMALMKAKSVVDAGDIESEKVKAAWGKELNRVASKKATDQYLSVNRLGGELPYMSKMRGKNMVVYYEKLGGEKTNSIMRGVQLARNFMYLLVANDMLLFPVETHPDQLFKIASGYEDPPDWFKIDTKLPALEGKR